MLIAQITDIHIGFDKGNPDEHNMVRLRAVLGHLVNGPNRPDLLLLSGDLTEDGAPADYARLAEAVAAGFERIEHDEPQGGMIERVVDEAIC